MHVEPFEEAIRSALPAGWVLAGQGRQLVLRREKTVVFYSTRSMPDLRTEEDWGAYLETYGFEGSFLVVCWFDRPVPPATYRFLELQNAFARSQQARLAEDVERMVSSEKGSWQPQTQEERAVVDEYRLACDTLPFHRLPDVNNEEFSAYIASSLDRHGSRGDVAIHPHEAFEECRGVVERVRELLKRPPARS